MNHLFLSFLVLVFTVPSGAQSDQTNSNPSGIDNLVLPAGYNCSATGAIPHYTKVGKGAQSLILIPGLGFDETIFDDFIKANRKHFTIYAITIPGYGKTEAPALPPVGTSFGEQTWNKSVIEGIRKLITQEQIKKPIVAGHFVQGTQLALRIAIDFPELLGGVIILGGPAKFILINRGKPVEYPLANSISYIDKVTAPTWFKTITKTDYDAGNYLPEVYSLNPTIANLLWTQSASVPLPVAVHALCEFFASDITIETDKINIPVLILQPTFTDEILQKTVNNYLVPQFITAWDKVKNGNPLFQVIDIPDASTFVWKDNAKAVNKQINNFSKSILELRK
jgi:pimeloyl-ACP methyl ester carboxylesterase